MKDERHVGGDETEPTSPAPEGEEVDLGSRVAGASAWVFGSMGGVFLTKTLANVALAALLVPDHWAVIAILRVFLMAVEMFSDVGIRGSVVYHRAGLAQSFLNTSWTLQILRSVVMWLLCCALAWPVASWYDQPLLLWMLPICGFEVVNNGFLSVGVYTRQRTMQVGMPILLEWIGLAATVIASILWALVDPSPWALAIGPLFGGFVKTGLSHVLIPEVRLRFQWDRKAVHDLIHFAKWVYVGTIATFIAQQFLALYLGKVVTDTVLSLYWLAWSLSTQSTRPMTLIANQVLIPLFAQGGRISADEHRARIGQAMHRFLPACLLMVLLVAFGCPAFFGFLYREDYHDAGTMGWYIGVVIWFMLLQHVPRAAMLSVGNSRGTSFMAVANAVVTIGGCVAGYRYGTDIGLGPLKGAILGNALGNVVGCVVGAGSSARAGIPVGRPMLAYSFLFTVLFLGGTATERWLRGLHEGISEPVASLLVTAAVGIVLLPFVWKQTVRTALARRRADAGVTTP